MDGMKLLSFSLKTLILVAVVAGAAALASSSGLAQSEAILVPIGTMALGASPPDFEFARTGQGSLGTWVVAADRDSFGDRAIEQSSTDTTDYRFPLAIYKLVSAKNVEVSIRFKPVAGRVDQAGGVVVRLIDADNYYVARANALEDNVRFYRVVNGRRELIEGVNTKVARNVWHTVMLRAEGERFTVTFNGKPLFTATDRTIDRAGRVALWTKSDSVTRFDRIEITTLP